MNPIFTTGLKPHNKPTSIQKEPHVAYAYTARERLDTCWRRVHRTKKQIDTCLRHRHPPHRPESSPELNGHHRAPPGTRSITQHPPSSSLTPSTHEFHPMESITIESRSHPSTNSFTTKNRSHHLAESINRPIAISSASLKHQLKPAAFTGGEGDDARVKAGHRCSCCHRCRKKEKKKKHSRR
ncbi:hypothetical protein YC2023_030299 [Brassica napus]